MVIMVHSNIRSAWCGSASTTDTKALWSCCWPCHCATAATSVSDAYPGLCHLYHWFSTGRFLFQSWASHHFVFLYVWCMPSAFRCHTGCHIHLWGLNHWVFHHCNPLELTCGRHICNMVMVISPHQVCKEWLLPPPLWVGEPAATQSAVIQPFQLYGGAYIFGGLAESHQIPPPSLHSEEGSSSPGLVSSDDTVDSESAVGIKPGDSCVVIGNQVDEFTHIWSAE